MALNAAIKRERKKGKKVGEREGGIWGVL